MSLQRGCQAAHAVAACPAGTKSRESSRMCLAIVACHVSFLLRQAHASLCQVYPRNTCWRPCMVCLAACVSKRNFGSFYCGCIKMIGVWTHDSQAWAWPGLQLVSRALAGSQQHPGDTVQDWPQAGRRSTRHATICLRLIERSVQGGVEAVLDIFFQHSRILEGSENGSLQQPRIL